MHKAQHFSFVTFFFFPGFISKFLRKKSQQNVSKNENYHEKLQNVSVHYKDLKMTSPKLDLELALDNSFLKFLIFFNIFCLSL